MISLKEFDYETVKEVINCSYHGQCEIDDDSMECVSEATNFLQFDLFKNALLKHLSCSLQKENVFQIHQIAKMFHETSLLKMADEFICKHFTELVEQNKDFMKVDKEYLLDLLSKHEIDVDSEEVMFLAIDKWINFDSASRSHYMLELLHMVK